MKEELIKVLEDRCEGRVLNLENILKVENDSEIKEILDNIFAGVKTVSYLRLEELTKSIFVINLLYDYIEDNNITIVEEFNCDFYDKLHDATSIFLKEASRYHVLSLRQEYECGKLLKYGSEEEKVRAREKLVNHNQRLVIKIARKYVGNGMDLIDLIQEGNSGFVENINKYDVDLGNRFSTFITYWIRQKIIRELANKSRTIRIPVNNVDFLLSVRKNEGLFRQKYNRKPTNRELALFMKDSYYFGNLERNVQQYYGGCPKISEDKRKYYENKYKDIPIKSYKKYPAISGEYSLKRIIERDSTWYNLNFESDFERYKTDHLERAIKNIKENINSVVSYDRVVDDEDTRDNIAFSNFLVDTRDEVNPEVSCEKKFLKDLLPELFERVGLDDRAIEVLRLRYGLDSNCKKSPLEICLALRGNKYTVDDLNKIKKDIRVAEEKIKENPEEVKKLIEGKKDSVLSLYERVLLELKYSITTTNTYTTTELGSVFNFTREGVRKIEKKSLKKIGSNILVKQKIKEYIDS